MCRSSGRKCCPKLTVLSEGAVLADDFGGRVILTSEQLSDLILEFREEKFDVHIAPDHS